MDYNCRRPCLKPIYRVMIFSPEFIRGRLDSTIHLNYHVNINRHAINCMATKQRPMNGLRLRARF